MKPQLILARAIGYKCFAVFLNQIVVAETSAMSDVDVVKTAKQLSIALRVPVVECAVEVPDELDGIWEWPDMLAKLPPVEEQIARQPFVIYSWSEGGVHPGTVDGPGDAWDGVCFDFEPPVAGTPYHILAPVHLSRGKALDDVVRAKVLEDFKHWLNDRRMQHVSAVFHETVDMAASLISFTSEQPDPETLVEQVTMGVLGKKVDPTPGINWYCNRDWKVEDVRAAVRRAMQVAGIIPVTERVPDGDSSELDL
ncbi:hypothetical protein P5X00_36400 [Paraburkholderia sp. A2RO-4L]|uniref:hypothetical protein n=1 Tax=Paraburkholderia sp. A2RO-4L TaxID=3028374 RepID=UPI0032F41170|nr:hypothetical protein [Burkholderia vietnamiensis]